MTYDLRPVEGGGYRIDAYVYQLSLAGCDDEHQSAGGDWYGMLRGGMDPSATAALDMGMTEDEKAFLVTMAGAIVHESSQGSPRVTYYNNIYALNAAWQRTTEPPRPGGPQP